MDHSDNKRNGTLPDLLPPHCGYRELKSYQMAETVKDAICWLEEVDRLSLLSRRYVP